jgi:hypothetical protein
MAFFSRGSRYSTRGRSNNPSPLRRSTAASTDRSGDISNNSTLDDKSSQDAGSQFVVVQAPTNRPGTFKKRDPEPEIENQKQESRLQKQERLIQGQFAFVQGPSKRPGTFGKSESKPDQIPGLNTTDGLNTSQVRDQRVVAQAPTNKPGTFLRRDPEPGNSPRSSAIHEPMTSRRSRSRINDDWPRDPMTGVRYELTVILYEAAPRTTV